MNLQNHTGIARLIILPALCLGLLSPNNKVLSQTTRTLTSQSDVLNCLEFSKSGKYLIAGGSSKVVEIWEVSSGERLKELKGHGEPVFKALISPDERFAVSTTAAKGGLLSVSAELKIWDMDTGTPRHSTSAGPLVYTLSFNDEGSLIAVGTADKIQIFSTENGTKTNEIKTKKMINLAGFKKENIISLLIPYDKVDKTIIPRSNNFTLKTFNSITGNELNSFATPEFWEMFVKIYELYEFNISALPPQTEMLSGIKAEQANLFFILKPDNLIEIWDPSEGLKLGTLKKGFAVRNMAIENSGRYIATSGDNNLISLWDLASMPEVASRMATK